MYTPKITLSHLGPRIEIQSIMNVCRDFRDYVLCIGDSYSCQSFYYRVWGKYHFKDSALHLSYTDIFALDICKIFFGKWKSVNTSLTCENTSNKTNFGKVRLVLSYLIFYYHSLLLTHITWPISSWVLLGSESQQKHALLSLYKKVGKSQLCRAAASLVPWKCLMPPGDTSIC